MEKHFAVSGFVMNPEKNKLLMVHHKKLNKWVIPGGHLEENEFPFAGARREIMEETGVTAKVLDCSGFSVSSTKKETQIPNPMMTLQELIPAKGDKPEHIHIDLIFLCEAEEGKVKGQEDEVNDVKWMSIWDVAEADTFDSIKAFAKFMIGA